MSPVNVRDTDSDGNDWANCIGGNWPAKWAEMLIADSAKIPIFTGSKCRLTFYSTPTGKYPIRLAFCVTKCRQLCIIADNS